MGKVHVFTRTKMIFEMRYKINYGNKFLSLNGESELHGTTVKTFRTTNTSSNKINETVRVKLFVKVRLDDFCREIFPADYIRLARYMEHLVQETFSVSNKVQLCPSSFEIHENRAMIMGYAVFLKFLVIR